MEKRIVKVFIVVSIIIFLLLAFLLLTNNLSWLDDFIRIFIASFTNCTNTKIMKAITLMGDSRILLVLSLFVLIYVWSKKREYLYFPMILFIIGSTNLLNYMVKAIFYRPRPTWHLITEAGYSFPSGHAMVSIAFYGYIIYLIHKHLKNKWKYLIEVLLGILIFFIGISRIYLGVHYTSDVLGGFALGFIWLTICIYYTVQLLKQYK